MDATDDSAARRRLLAIDVSRLAGLLAAAIGEASQLDLSIPDGIPDCTGGTGQLGDGAPGRRAGMSDHIWLLVGALLGLTPGAVLDAALMRWVLRRPGD